MKFLIRILMLVFSITAVQAQETTKIMTPKKELKFDAEVIASSSPAVVLGAPFSAEAVSESVQVLADGNKLTRTVTTKMYRDGEGRFRREHQPNLAGSLGTVINVQQTISILDPVSGVQFFLNPSTKTARRFKTAASRAKEVVSQSRIETGAITQQNQVVNVQPNAASSLDSTKIESLGVREIEGVKATGTRSTKTVAAGEIGNERAFDVVYERWYSEELQEIVLSRHTDPRFGVQTYRLLNIKRSEPDRSLFAPPADYKITDSKASTYEINRTL